MPCLCPTNTLRLFIRSVAQVELPSSAIRTPHTQWQKTAIRSFSSTGGEQLSKSAFLRSKECIPFETSPPDTEKPHFGSKAWAQGVVEGTRALREEQINSSGYTNDWQAGKGSNSVETAEESSAIPSRIENRKARKARRLGKTLAAEIKPKTREAGKVKEVRKARRQENEPEAEITPISRVIEEKTKVYNSGFKIHYSAPPVPVSERKSKTDNITSSRSSEPAKKKEKSGDEWTPPPREHWQIDKAALKAKFPEGWKPLRRLSPDALAGIRALHAQDPAQYTTAVLANSFEVSPEAMRRILKSKWSPDAEEESDRLRRWHNRGKSVYSRFVELGVLKPPKKWRELGIGNGKPEWMVQKQKNRREMAEMGETQIPALIASGRARDTKYGLRRKGERREKSPLPALVTTRRAEAAPAVDESLEDRIL